LRTALARSHSLEDGRGYPTRRYKSKKGAEYELIEVKPGSKRKRSSSASKKPKSAATSKSSADLVYLPMVR
jgi:hypothetical protein